MPRATKQQGEQPAPSEQDGPDQDVASSDAEISGKPRQSATDLPRALQTAFAKGDRYPTAIGFEAYRLHLQLLLSAYEEVPAKDAARMLLAGAVEPAHLTAMMAQRPGTPSEFYAAYSSVLGLSGTRRSAFDRLWALRANPHESFATHFTAFLLAMSNLTTPLSPDMVDNIFLAGMPAQLAPRVENRIYELTIEDPVKRLNAIADIVRPAWQEIFPAKTSVISSVSSDVTAPKGLSLRNAEHGAQLGECDEDQPVPDDVLAALQRSGKCYGCGGQGHMARDCPQRVVSEKKGKKKNFPTRPRNFSPGKSSNGFHSQGKPGQ